jgi:hypothetical protein
LAAWCLLVTPVEKGVHSEFHPISQAPPREGENNLYFVWAYFPGGHFMLADWAKVILPTDSSREKRRPHC